MKQNQLPTLTSKINGLSDVIYLAFISLLIVGGAYYIYNDIKTNPVTISSDTVSSKKIDAVANKEEKATIQEQPTNQVKTTQAKEISSSLLPEEKNQKTINDKMDDDLSVQVETKKADTANQISIEKATPADKESVIKNTLINHEHTDSKNSEPEKSAENKTIVETNISNVESIKAEDAVKTASTTVAPSEPSESSEAPTPSQTMYKMMPYQYNDAAHQVNRYAPNNYMQMPYYPNNGNSASNNRPYYPSNNQGGNYNQGYPNRAYSNQQRRPNNNNQRPSYQRAYEYTPWNPGRF